MASLTRQVTALLCLCLIVAQNSSGILSTNEVAILPASVAAATGSSVTLECTIPQNTSVLWYHDDSLLDANSQQLILPNITHADKGIYKCCVTECAAGNSATASVEVGDPPRVPLKLQCECRDYVNINCSWEMDSRGDANANVTLQIQDFDDNIWIDVRCKESNSSSKDKHQYCFFNPFDIQFTNPHYNYRAYSKNNFAEVTSDVVPFHKSSQAIPHPPDDINIQSYSSTSMTIHWCKPKKWPPSQASVLVFQVEYKADKDTEWIIKGTEDLDYKTGCKTTKVSLLKPYTLYCTRISSRKSNAWRTVPFSEPSEPVCAYTMEDAPGPPFDVKFEILPSSNEEKETRSARIKWMPVPKDKRNGIILGYRIVLFGTHDKDHTNTTRLEYNVTGDVTNLTVAGLDNYRTYTITVQAFNSAGMSWEKASPDGPIAAVDERTVAEVPPIAAAVIVPIALICVVFMMYCVWHRCKKILKPTYDIQIPERARNDNLYVSTVNFRMQESECFDELKAPPSGDLLVSLPPNGTCTFGNGTCPVSDYSEDPCTPGLAISENFPLLSGHMMEADHSGTDSQGANKMLTVDCGENKALLDGHPYSDVGYNQTGSPLSVASGGSYWTTAGEENESVSYHRMSPKGLALCEPEPDDQWEGGAVGGSGGIVPEPSSPNSDIGDSPNHDMCYSTMGKENTNKTKRSAPSEQDGRVGNLDLPKSPSSPLSPTSPTSPVAMYSMQASALDSPRRNHEEDSVSSGEDFNGEDEISSYVQQTTASSLGLLLPVPQGTKNGHKVKKKEGGSPSHKNTLKNSERKNQPPVKKEEGRKKPDDDTHSIDSEECVDGALDSYVRTGTNAVPQSPSKNQEVTGTTPESPVKAAAENYVKAGHGADTDRRGITPRVRSASSGALDNMRRTHASPPDFLDDSDSMISMEDLQYVQAGCLEDLTNAGNSSEGSAPPSPKFNTDLGATRIDSQNAVPASPVLPGVAIDFPSDGSGDTPNVSAGNQAAAPAAYDPGYLSSNDRQHSRDFASDNDLSDVEYEKYNDGSIDGYCTHGQGMAEDDANDEKCPMLPYVAIDLAEVPPKSTDNRPVDNVPEQHQPGSPTRLVQMPRPVCTTGGGYVPQTQAAHLMEQTKESSPTEKSAYDNPEYGVLAQRLNQLVQNGSQRNRVDHKQVNGDNEREQPSVDQDPVPITASNENLTDSPTNNNSPYVPHGKAPLRQNVQCPATAQTGDDPGYLPHGRIPAHALPGKIKSAEVNGIYVPHAQGLPEGQNTDKGYIPINDIPRV